MCEDHGIMRPQSISMPGFRVIVLAGAALQASNTCLNIAIQQDWVTCLSCGSSKKLSTLNSQLKRVDLGCRLLGPLIVSLLLTNLSHLSAAAVLMCVLLGMLLLDVCWAGLVYRLCTPLAREQAMNEERRRVRLTTAHALEDLGLPSVGKTTVLESTLRHWHDFINLPTLLSSIAVAFLSMNVLS